MCGNFHLDHRVTPLKIVRLGFLSVPSTITPGWPARASASPPHRQRQNECAAIHVPLLSAQRSVGAVLALLIVAAAGAFFGAPLLFQQQNGGSQVTTATPPVPPQAQAT